MAIVIIHSRTKEKISGTFTYEWSRHDFHRTQGGKLSCKSRLVTRKRAMEIIQEHGLVIAHKTRDGEVYDTQQGDFRAMFPNGLTDKADISIIEKTNNLV